MLLMPCWEGDDPQDEMVGGWVAGCLAATLN